MCACGSHWYPAGAAASPPLTIVQDGRATALIVVARQPSHAASEGAAVLASHLLQMSGAKVMQLADDSLSDALVRDGRLEIGARDRATLATNSIPNFILVGRSKWTDALGVNADDLGPGGMRVLVRGNTVVLLGTDDRTPADPGGTGYAVTTFLEALGVRYLWPGESGKVVPHQSTIVAPPLDQSITPRICQRRIRNQVYGSRLQTGLDMLGESKEDYISLRARAERTVATSPDWFAWQHMGGSLGLATGHSFGDLWVKYGKDHPEWFAMQADGSRDQSKSPDRPRICESNVALQAQIAHDRGADLDANPQLNSVSIDENDGGGTSFCMCPECKKLDAADGKPMVLHQMVNGKDVPVPYVSLTDRLVSFWNGIAEGVTQAHPNALLTVRAYSMYEAPPLHRKLHPNLVVEQVSGSYLNDEETRQWLAEWKRWSAMAPKISWRPNIYETSRRIGLPVIFVHKMAADFRERAHHSMVSTDIDSCFNNWSTGGLNLYVLARLHWNPDLDVDATIDDYCRSGFGAGASAVKRYLGRIEAITDAMAKNTEGANSAQIEALTVAYGPEVISAMRFDLDEGQRAIEASKDAASLGRLQFLRVGLDFTAVQAKAYQMQAAIKVNGGRPLDPAVTARFMAERSATMKQLFHQDVLAINMPYVMWAAEGNLSALRAFGPRTGTATGTVIDADERGRPVLAPGQ